MDPHGRALARRPAGDDGRKVAQLATPTCPLYQLIGRIARTGRTRSCWAETADLLVELLEQASASGGLGPAGVNSPDDAFFGLVDSFRRGLPPRRATPAGLVAERGWTGWTRLEKRET